MAFTKAPSQSTYQSKDVKLIWEITTRDHGGTNLSVATNGFFELVMNKKTNDNDYIFVKRDGCREYQYELENGNIRGMYYWEDQGKLFISYDTAIDVVNAADGVFITTLTPFTSTEGDVTFTEFNYDDGSTKLVVTDGTVLITIDSANTVVVGASPDQPPAFEPHVLFLDGYLFVVKSGTADIYNSDLGDPLAWTAGNFITTEMLPDTLIRLARLNNYIVAFGSASVEYFFDAGNADGSPLQRNDTPVKLIGWLGGTGSHTNKLIFVGQAANASPDIYLLEDFKIDAIATPALRRVLQGQNDYTATTVTNSGHDFYVLTIGNETYALDLESRLWTRWQFQDTSSFKMKYSVTVPVTGFGFVSLFGLFGQAGVFFFTQLLHQDIGVDFPVSVQTMRENFDTLHNKFMSRMLFFADKEDTSVAVSVSDDDYATFSTPRDVSLNNDKPILTRLGQFVSRVFRVEHLDNTPFRARHIEVDFNIGGR